MVLDKVQTRLLEMIPDISTPLVLAASGGVDSQVLLHILACAGYTRVHCVYCDHGLRKDTEKDWKCIQDAASHHGFTSARVEIGSLSGSDLENEARHRRYETLERHRQEQNAQWVLTGHHGNDLVESQLLHFTRGTGLFGLVGIQPQDPFRHLLRPMLECTKEEIRTYAEETGLQWHEDSTNASTDQTRNKLRHEVMPSLQALNPQIHEAGLQLSQVAAETLEFLTKTVLERMGDVFSTRSFQFATFLELPPVLQRHFLILIERQWGYQYSLSFIENILFCMKEGFQSGRRLYLTSGMFLERSFDTVYIRDAEEVPPELMLPDTVTIPEEIDPEQLQIQGLTPSLPVRQYRRRSEGGWEIWHTTVKKWFLKHHVPVSHRKSFCGLVTAEGEVVCLIHPSWTYPTDLPLITIPLPA